MLAIAFSVLCIVGVVALLIAEAHDRIRTRVTAKTIASVCFVIIGALHYNGNPAAAWLVAALVAGAAGDVLLTGTHTFTLGLVAFLSDHFFLTIAAATTTPVSTWPGFLLVPLVGLSAAVVVWLWPHLGDQKIPVVTYIAAITFMVWGVASSSLAEIWPWWAALAAVLFLFSDVLVARQRFVRPGFGNRLLGLPLYYAAQLLFAWLVGL